MHAVLRAIYNVLEMAFRELTAQGLEFAFFLLAADLAYNNYKLINTVATHAFPCRTARGLCITNKFLAGTCMGKVNARFRASEVMKMQILEPCLQLHTFIVFFLP